MTHSETAVWIQAVPLALTIAGMLLLAAIFRGALLALLQRLLTRYLGRGRDGYIEPALIWQPPVISAQQLLGVCLAAALLTLLLLSQLAPLFIAQALSGIWTAWLIWLLLWAMERRYVTRLESALPSTLSRFAAQLAAANGFQPALKKIVDDLPEGPLKAEWRFILARIGAPLEHGALASAEQVVASLCAQTPSPRQRALLSHLETALLGDRHDLLVARMQAAAEALHNEERRRSAAKTELAQMRYGGITIGSAGMLLAAYLFLTQHDRMVRAYSGSTGPIVAIVVISFLLLPLVGGFLLTRIDDSQY